MGKDFSTGHGETITQSISELSKAGGHGWNILYPQIQMLGPDYPFPVMAIPGDEGAKINEAKRVEL